MGVSNAGFRGNLTRTLLLGGVVAAAALLPLFGDPTGATVSHAEWARYLLRGLDLLDPSVRVGEQASVAFGILSGRDSLSFRGDRYVSARGVDATVCIPPSTCPALLTYVARTGCESATACSDEFLAATCSNNRVGANGARICSTWCNEDSDQPGYIDPCTPGESCEFGFCADDPDIP